ncbi:MAG TPA: sigma 54-interacting transcriptional regulator [Pyrinomonadaceae bacterium]|nr:sigma 54-interacting transcriptional regulator [Pyrinomonadaceae bacterium]
MKPRLAAIAGPLKGSVYQFDGGELTVGRDASNHVSVTDGSLSRRHCRLERRGGQFLILDLESSNGTFVNGLPVKEQTLEHGDHITAGGSRFVFMLEEGEPPTPRAGVRLSEREVVAGETVRLRVEDALYLRPEKLSASLPPLGQMARDLTVLLKISTAINSIREPNELQRRLLEFIFEVVPASRGAILLAGRGPDDIASVFGMDKASGHEQPLEVSSTIARQVLGEGVAVLSNDVLTAGEFAGAQSLISSGVRSLLCVPLVLYGRVLGVIYLTTNDPAARFGEDHLQLLTVVSSIAAVALENARHVTWLEGENERLRTDSRIEHNMVGQSARMKEVYAVIARVAPTDSTVLVRGESGTGKELAARAIHDNSLRAGKPFVAINCAALTETLLESELFGHERGAFTGALAQKKGKFEVADGGTLFLDEVGELAPVLQAKLLRALQEREFERVGGTRTIKVDVRVIAATNRDLEQAVRGQTFRQDLYYRLNVVSFEMPALRDRREDIPLLASYFVGKYADKFKRKVTGVSPEARACLVGYDWPGNVRELENAVERAVVLGSTDRLLPEDLPETVLEAEQPGGAASASTKYHEAVREAKKQLILRAVAQAGGSYTDAAKLLGVHPNYLHRLVRNLNLKEELKSSK